MKTMKKYVLVYGLFIRCSIMGAMEYRANFIAGVAVECCFLSVKLLYVFIAFLPGVSINSLSPYFVMLYVGNYTIITGIYNGLFAENLWWLPFNIRTGALDLMLVKPISTQFFISTRKLSLPMLIANVLTGLIMVSIALSRIEGLVNITSVVLFLVTLICGVSIAYFIFLLPMLLSFWTIESRGLITISDKAWDINIMPMQIYRKNVRRIFVFVLPLFAVTNFQPLALINQLEYIHLIWAVLCPVILFVVSRALFLKGIRKYASANG